MFAVIDTNGASHIVIHVPHEGAEKSLPALARMLEENTTFIRSGYREFSLAKPKMSIELGDTYCIEGQDETLAIATVDSVLDEDFVNATPEVLVSNKKAREKASAEEQRLRNELAFAKDELERLKAKLEALTSDEPI